MSKASASETLTPQFEVKSSPSGSADTDVVGVFQDSGRKAVPPKGPYAAYVQRLRRSEVFAARAGSFQFVRFGGKSGSENCLFAGLGTAAELTEEKLRAAGANLWAKLNAERVTSAMIHAESFFASGLRAELSRSRILRAYAEGIALAAYEYRGYRTTARGAASSGSSPGSSAGFKDAYKGPRKITMLTRESGLKLALDLELARVAAIADAVRVTRDWSNEPSNYGTPEYYANEARKLARENGLTCKILTERDAEREKMGLFLGVGRGSVREGRIVVLEYRPKGVKNPKTIAFVGKGVTFDSGGISIKPSMRMEDMKHDMTGAATLMGAILLASRWKAPNRIIAVLAFTENMPDGDAIQPGNVLTSRAGKTVEVINTDAEGRLILADVLDYAQDLKPDAMINAATLTGAVSIALGKQCCGIMGNEESLIDAIRRSGEVCGERIWQLPLYDEYFDDLKSDVADMKNSANDSYGGTIRGAIFLKQFIRKGTAWAHLDIAATAWSMGHVPYFPKKGASGMYVRTLAQFAMDF